MWLSYLHLTAKQHVMIFKYNEFIDILAWPLAIFARWKKTFASKHSKTESLKQHSEHFDVDSHCVCSNCSPPAFVHLVSRSMKLLTALLIGSCGMLSQITGNASLSSVIHLGLG